MLKAIKTALLLVFLSCTLQAQLITERDGKYGLVSPAGDVLLQPVYDKIVAFSDAPLAYRYRLGNKWGIYSCYSGTDTGPVYDLISGNDASYFAYRGKKAGILKQNTNINKDTMIIGPTIYDEVIRIDNYHYCVRIDSLYGGQNTVNNDTLPVVFRNPLGYNYPAGYYEKLPGGKINLLLGRDEKGEWLRCTLPDEKFNYNENIIYCRDREKALFIMVNMKAKRKVLEVPYTDFYFKARFEEENKWAVVSDTIPGTSENSKNRLRITCYKPDDGSRFLTVDVPANHRLYVDDISFAGRHLGQTYKVYAADALRNSSKQKRIYLGTITQYTFTPYDTPRVVTVARKTNGPHRSGKPFFMPGGD